MKIHILFLFLPLYCFAQDRPSRAEVREDTRKAAVNQLNREMLEIEKGFTRSEMMDFIVADTTLRKEDKIVLLQYITWKFDKYEYKKSVDNYFSFTREARTIRNNVIDVIKFAKIGYVPDSIRTYSGLKFKP